MPVFWKRVFAAKPNIVGATVYFSPSKRADLACILREDGSVSPTTSPDLRFDRVSPLAMAWKKGEVTAENGSKFPRDKKPSKFSFQHDFFLKTGRKEPVRSLLRRPTSEPAPKPAYLLVDLSSINQKIHRLSAHSSTMAEIKTASVIDFSRGMETAAPRPIEGKRLCPGFDRRKHQPAISKRQWDGARMAFSPVISEGDRCRSKFCLGEISGKRSACCTACKLGQRRLWDARRLLVKKTPDDVRIRSTNYKWLTPDEIQMRKEMRLEKAMSLLREAKAENRWLKKQLRQSQK